ncbi:hypothetical protein [Oceanobacillus sp. FSL H7-0719]|uniref:hypothetical protein n=1 Tax=Oceanobacillus sp. FSL H7-0719 TaxID=2954507 RepID=UPI0032481310
MRTLLELLRIFIIFIFLGGFGWLLIVNIYSLFDVTENDTWIGGLAIFILLFVLYRNKLQFSGWYKGKGRRKLPRNISLPLILVSIILLIAPIILGLL